MQEQCCHQGSLWNVWRHTVIEDQRHRLEQPHSSNPAGRNHDAILYHRGDAAEDLLCPFCEVVLLFINTLIDKYCRSPPPPQIDYIIIVDDSGSYLLHQTCYISGYGTIE
mmetsp:Transcript_4197/g.7017  ORF Transcript_4197/g.7017 Transcript_4197/m.7017 type:complete len:110 (-) Transcript_4197:38-367(-)